MQLPKYNNSSKKGEQGITIVKKLVENDLNWIFRKNHQENDFGIDAYIDVISQTNEITGKSIALQIKTGESYFLEKTNIGWVYRGTIEHLNYYLNHDIPVVILLVNEREEKVYWDVCKPEKTERAGNNWKMIIPFNKEFNSTSKMELRNYISPVRDYVSQLEEFWKENEELKNAGWILFNIDKSDIESKNHHALLNGIERLKLNNSLIESLKGKIDIGIYGYESDKRELYEIPEVIEWVNMIFNNVNGLSYFISTEKAASFLRVMQYVNMKYIIIDYNYIHPNGRKGRHTEIDLSTGEEFYNKLFYDLNSFTEKHHIPIEVNKERSFALMEYLTGEKLPEDIKDKADHFDK